MKWSLEGKWIAIASGLALLLMSIDSVISYENAIQLIQSTNKVKHTQEVLKNLTDVFTTITDAESAQQGYLLFKDESELKRYKIVIQSIAPKLKTLQQLTADNPRQRKQLLVLESLLSQRLALLRQSIDLYQSDKLLSSTQAPLGQESKRNRNEIRKAVVQMQSEEKKLLEMRFRQSEVGLNYRILIEIIDTFLTFAILCGLYIILYRQMVKRQQAETIQWTLAQEKELGELKLCFFSMVSHEFRTPLTTILGTAQLMAESSQQWTHQKKLKNLLRIQSSAKLMTQLLTDILTLTRAEAGKLECNLELVDLESFCLNLVEDIQSGNKTSHSIKFISLSQYTHAYLDEKLLYSILGNLLLNAIKYSPQGGNVLFILSCGLEAVSFQIKDEGVGMTLEDQQALYEPFHRGKNVGDIVGTGLGLAVVKKCLELHQGQISVESQVGVGTTFTIDIPLLSK